MSRMSGESIYRSMGEIGEDLILEATPVALLAGAAAVGGLQSTADLRAASGTARRGLGAWVSKGGWALLTAGAVAVAGIAVGGFLLGNREPDPSLGENPALVESLEESESESERETVSEEATSEEMTAEETLAEETAEESVAEDTDVAETTEDGTAEGEILRYFQFPLRTSRDTTSYVSVPDLSRESRGAIEFFVLPSDTDNPELVSAYKLYVSKEIPMNLQIVAFKSENSYGILYMMEKAQPFPQGGNPNELVIGLDWYCLYFNGTEKGGYYVRDYGYDSSLGSYHFVHTEGEKVSGAAYKHNDAYLRKAEKFIGNYSDASRYEYTVLYSYIDGVETVNTPVEALPEFSFDIFNTYNQPDLGD